MKTTQKILICAVLLMATSTQAVNVDIYEGFTQDGGGAPYKGLVGSLVSPDIMFATNTAYAWHPFELDRFGAEITGCLNVADDDIYEFGLDSDDGSMLYIDGVLVVNNGGAHSPLLVYDKTFLTAGTHSFKVEFFEDFGGPSGVDLILPDGVTYAPCVIEVDIDIKPGSCPNPLNVTNKGTLPVAILGSKDFDVFTIDPASIRLEGVPPERSSYEDVATPVPDPKDDCACTTEGADGYWDMTLKFETEAVVRAIGYARDGDYVPLTLTGKDSSGVPIVGTDCVLIIDNTKPLITSVIRDGVTDGQPIVVGGPSPRGLQEGSHAFMDRPMDEFDTRNYHWQDIPAEIVGADYVMTYNEDKQPGYAPEVYEVSYTVTLRKAAVLYIFVDVRYAPFPWLTDGSAGAFFADTGRDIMLNEVGGREVLQPYDIYEAEVSAGTYVLGPSCDGNGSRSFYSIAATEP